MLGDTRHIMYYEGLQNIHNVSQQMFTTDCFYAFSFFLFLNQLESLMKFSELYFSVLPCFVCMVVCISLIFFIPAGDKVCYFVNVVK